MKKTHIISIIYMKVVIVMFNKLVVIEPINMLSSYKEKLSKYAKEVIFYDDIPESDEIIINRKYRIIQSIKKHRTILCASFVLFIIYLVVAHHELSIYIH